MQPARGRGQAALLGDGGEGPDLAYLHAPIASESSLTLGAVVRNGGAGYLVEPAIRRQPHVVRAGADDPAEPAEGAIPRHHRARGALRDGQDVAVQAPAPQG